MKEIRKIKNVTKFLCKRRKPKEKPLDLSEILTIESLDSGSNYFKMIVRPMLSPGHDSELVYWLRTMGLVPPSQNCKICDKAMMWTPFKGIDLYQWRCRTCKVSSSIRKDSIFYGLKCDFKSALRILLGWCKGKDLKALANVLHAKKTVVLALYKLAMQYATIYVQTNLSTFQLGGKDVIVLIDTFPEGCAINNNNDDSIYNNSNTKPILCLAEVKDVPPKFWFEVLEKCGRSNRETRERNKAKCLNAIKKMVHPGSILVTRQSSTFCSYSDVKELQTRHPIIVHTDSLSRHDNNEQNLMENIEVIWREAVNICVTAHQCSSNLTQSHLVSFVWSRHFNEDAFQMLINQLII